MRNHISVDPQLVGSREHPEIVSVDRTNFWDWSFALVEATATLAATVLFNGHCTMKWNTAGVVLTAFFANGPPRGK